MPYMSNRAWRKAYINSLSRMSNDLLIKELISMAVGADFTHYKTEWVIFCRDEARKELLKRLEKN